LHSIESIGAYISVTLGRRVLVGRVLQIGRLMRCDTLVRMNLFVLVVPSVKISARKSHPFTAARLICAIRRHRLLCARAGWVVIDEVKVIVEVNIIVLGGGVVHFARVVLVR